ncbi:hypothetical protein DFJ73DRAFT_489404 [Zopfochytrium polystomum]|nr:hypothetical protein DFJ73DRAFT_489404 [Zopfochytrium polystomum]
MGDDLDWIKALLRSTELLDLQFESNVDQNCLNWDLTVIQDGFIEGLCFKIKGKKDNQPNQLILWADHKNPALCPVRHLLLYIHLSGLKSGYLFASAEVWKCSDRGHHCSHEDALSYGSFQQYFQHLCETVIKRDGKFGSHSIRKTGYVLMRSPLHLQGLIYSLVAKGIRQVFKMGSSWLLAEPVPWIQLKLNKDG